MSFLLDHLLPAEWGPRAPDPKGTGVGVTPPPSSSLPRPAWGGGGGGCGAGGRRYLPGISSAFGDPIIGVHIRGQAGGPCTWVAFGALAAPRPARWSGLPA